MSPDAMTSNLMEEISTAVTADEAFEIAIEAYHFLYPLITMDVTRRVLNNRPIEGGNGIGQTNVFQHMRSYPPAEFREVVRPNFDTLYSTTWLDLTQEPQVVSVPDTDGRYYLLPMIDMWTDVFAVPGKRTSGTSAGHYAVTPPGWSGSLPDDLEQIPAPTPLLWIIGRTQTNGPADYAAVNALQDQFAITPLSSWGRALGLPPSNANSSPDPSVDMKEPPLNQVNNMQPHQYFNYGAELMKLHAPHTTDWSILKRMQRIGIAPGEPFNLDKFSPEMKDAISRAIPEALNRMKVKAGQGTRAVNGWQILTEGIGVYGNSYLGRAAIAMIGLGANQPEDAIYPVCSVDMEGQPLRGGKQYLVHFAPGEEPPANAFWSLTLYDDEGFPTANSLNRCAIGDRDALQYNDDGSVDIYLQDTSPGSDRESNWLPTPSEGTWNLTMRLYAPKAEVTNGQWKPPAITRLN